MQDRHASAGSRLVHARQIDTDPAIDFDIVTPFRRVCAATPHTRLRGRPRQYRGRVERSDSLGSKRTHHGRRDDLTLLELVQGIEDLPANHPFLRGMRVGRDAWELIWRWPAVQANLFRSQRPPSPLATKPALHHAPPWLMCRHSSKLPRTAKQIPKGQC